MVRGGAEIGRTERDKNYKGQEDGKKDKSEKDKKI